MFKGNKKIEMKSFPFITLAEKNVEEYQYSAAENHKTVTVKRT